MKTKIFGVGVALMLFGGAGLAGNIETNGNLIIPAVIAIVGTILMLSTRKEICDEEARIYQYSGNSARPKYLPKR